MKVRRQGDEEISGEFHHQQSAVINQGLVSGFFHDYFLDRIGYLLNGSKLVLHYQPAKIIHLDRAITLLVHQAIAEHDKEVMLIETQIATLKIGKVRNSQRFPLHFQKLHLVSGIAVIDLRVMSG
jgi:hypothetical protein